jgi:hypothetical protein
MDLSASQKVTNHLTIGLLSPSNAWSTVLMQIGVHYSIVDLHSPSLSNRYSVIIVNGKPDSDQLQKLRSYHREGGALLDTGPYLKQIEKSRISRKSVGQIMPRPQGPFRFVGRIDLHQRSYTYKSASHLENTVLLPGESRYNRLAFLGWDLDKALSSQYSTRKSFLMPAHLSPNEIVSKVSRASIRRSVRVLLNRLHQARNLPFVYLSAIPDGYTKFFGFRIDTDYGTQNSLNKLIRLGQNHDLSMSWFLHVEAHQNWLNYFQSFNANQEIALHGYHHQTYNSYKKNYQNIEKGFEILKKNDFEIQGFCSPYGLWNKHLQQAIETFNFLYSSEFAYDHDNLPSRPLINNEICDSLQIPIHPIGVGRLQHAGASKPQILSYFKHVVNLQFSRHEPVFLYHHPNQEGISIFSKLLESISNEKYCNWTMKQYAKWWKRREQLVWHPQITNKQLIFNTESRNRSVRAKVFRDDHTYTLTKLDDPLSINKGKTQHFEPDTPLSVMRNQKESYYSWPLVKSSILDFINRLDS